MIEITVLSLFDGISGGQQALKKIKDIKIKEYIASEIEKSAIEITRYNFPQTKFIGDVTKINIKELPKIDLLIGGSPCQGFSFSGKREGAVTKEKIEITTLNQYLKYKEEGFLFSGQSYLFWEYVRIYKELKKINPKLKFLLENVQMEKKWKKVFDKTMEVEATLIDSSLVSAQQRKRFYWTNKGKDLKQPSDKKIFLKDILEDKKQINKASIVGRRLNKEGKRDDYNKEIKITQCLEVRKTNINKSNCITTVSKDNVLTELDFGRHPDVYKKKLPYRHYTIKELERLQTIEDDYTKYGLDENQKIKEISPSKRKFSIGNGWTINVIEHIIKELFFS